MKKYKIWYIPQNWDQFLSLAQNLHHTFNYTYYSISIRLTESSFVTYPKIYNPYILNAKSIFEYF